MANQQELSDFIKKVHIDLRLASREIGAEAAWKEHCKKDDILKKYAITMRELSTKYWNKNFCNDSMISRINWIVKECDWYFSNEGLKKLLEKEQKLAKFYFGEVHEIKHDFLQLKKVIKLLDVGSCYNPFKNFEQFDVTAIDLAPATEDVLRCDFLEVKLDNQLEIKEGTVTTLPEQYFDVVVFSLLLEYLPQPSFRYNCCKKAYDLLRPGGTLLIITPDSKHASANSQLIKSWRMALADIGYLKVNYEKTVHLHCMSYTKCFDIRLPKKWLSLKNQNIDDADNMMVIPQDNVQYIKAENVKCEQRCESDNKIVADNFSELVGENVF